MFLTVMGRFKLCRKDYYIELFIERSIYVITITIVNVYLLRYNTIEKRWDR